MPFYIIGSAGYAKTDNPRRFDVVLLARH
jgi:hypothetical protein